MKKSVKSANTDSNVGQSELRGGDIVYAKYDSNIPIGVGRVVLCVPPFNSYVIDLFGKEHFITFHREELIFICRKNKRMYKKCERCKYKFMCWTDSWE